MVRLPATDDIIGGCLSRPVADLIIEAAESAGASPDADEDAAMVGAGLGGDPTISQEANEILADMLVGCASE